MATTSATVARKKRTRGLLQRKKHTKDRVRRKRRTRPGSGGTAAAGGVNARDETDTRGQRNVNWDSPIKVHFEMGSQPLTTTTPVPEIISSSSSSNSSLRCRRRGMCKGEDDGFESLNGKSSSGDESHLSEQLRTTGEDGSLISDLPAEEVQESGGVEQPKISTTASCELAKGRGDHSDTDEEREDEIDLNLSSPGRNSSGAFTEGTNSNAEWCGVTTNSEECSYSSDLEHTDSQDFAPTVILNSNCGAMDRSEWVDRC